MFKRYDDMSGAAPLRVVYAPVPHDGRFHDLLDRLAQQDAAPEANRLTGQDPHTGVDPA